MRVNERMKKLLSIVLTLCMVLSCIPAPAYAVGTDCTHHTEHTADCGYVAAVEGVPCAHEHDENCGYVEAVAEVLCACEATDENGVIVHTEGCGYVAAVPGSDCAHVHDDACGYVQAVKGSDCTFVCTECKAEEKTCTCESTDPGEHAPFCDLYVRTYEECKCVLDCAVEGLNDYCETCYFEGVDACAASGEEEASAYLTEGTDYTITNGKLVIHDGVTKIDDYAFYGKTITSVVIPTSVTTIGNYAFYYCSKLTAVTIAGNSSLTIGDYAFYYCSNLSSVTYQSTSAPASIGYKAFYGTKAKSVDVPSGFPTNYSFGGLSLNIVGGGPVAVESVTFKRNGNDAGSRVSMTCKAPMQLTADISPANADNKKVTWTQAEQNGAKPFLTIANDGTITATFAGYTAADFEPFVYGYYSDVTVTTEDGSKTDTVTVEVNRYTLVIKDGETERFRLPRPAGYALSGLIPAEYTTPSKPGYIFKGWKRAYEKADGTMGYDNLIKSLPATMPHTSASNAAHEQIYVEQWEVDPDATFAVNVSNTTGGTVTANHSAAAAETVITLTVNVSNGYELEGFTDGTNAITTTKVDDTTYTFVMPNRDVTVTPVYKSLHQHQWAYSVNAAKDTITATCTSANCPNTDGGSVTIYAPKHSVYGDGKEEQASYKWTMVYPTTGSTIFYEKKTENGTWENITQAPTDAGTYKASLTVDIIEKTISVEYTIEKAAPVITWDSTTASTNYTGSEAVITAPVITLANGETFNGTISYSYTGTSSGNGLPTNAGTYEITASIDTYGNYNAATSSNTLELTINKVDPSYTVPTGLTATYGDTLADVALPDGFSWANSSESVGAVGTKNTTVIYTPADTTNYNTVTNIAVSVEVKAAAATVTKAPTANTLTYTGSAQDLINAGSANGGKLVYSLSEDGEFIETIPAGTNAGEYTVWYYVVGDDNHADSAKGSVKVTITKAKATITVDTTTINITYGETVTLPEATTNFGTVTCDKIAADLVNAGTYTVTYTVAGTDNYDGDTKTLTVKVEKKAVAEPTITGTYTYTGTEQTVALAGIESCMTIASGNKATNTGSYEVVLTLDGNHKWADGSDGKVQWNIAKAKAEITVDTDPITVTYGDSVELPEATTNFGTVSCDKTTNDLVNAGTCTVTYSVAGTDNYDGDSKTVIVTIEKLAVAEPTVTGTYTYTGKEQTVTLTGVERYMTIASGNKGTNAGNYEVVITLDSNHKWADGSDGKVQWSIGKAKAEITVDTDPITVTYGDSVELPAATTNFGTVTCDKAASDLVNAGTYTVTYSVAGTDNYDGDTKTVTVTINPKTITEADVALDGALTYNGKEQTQQITVTDGITYEISGNKATNVDTYELTVKGTGNYTGEVKLNWSIKAAAATVETAPTAKELTYTGEDLALVTAGTANGGKLVYSLSENGTYTETIPTGTNAGDYTVWYYVQGDANHADSAKASVKVTIAKAQAEITVDTTPITVTYGEAVTLPIATANFGEVDCDKTAAELVNAGTYTVTYTVDGTDNYEGDSKTVTVTIEKLAVAEPTVTGTYTYTGTEQTVALAGIESYMTIASGNKATNAGSYEVVITLDGNHKWANGSDGKVQWNMAKAKAEISVVTTPITITYGDSVELPEATTNFGTVSCDKTANDLVNAGTYTVTYSVAGTDNYDGDTKTVTVTIEKLAVAEPTVTGTYTYTGKEQTVTLTGVERYMTIASGNKGTNAGNYEVVITLDSNHKWADGSDGKVQWSIGKAKAEITVDTDTITVTYGEAVTLPTATTNFGTVTCDKAASNFVNAGTYTVTYSVADTDNYDGDTKTVTVTINPKTITEADVKLNGALTYNGKEQTQQITVTDGITYEVTGNKATKAGKYELTVKGTGNYAGTITLDWEVAKATVTITADNKVIYIGEDIPVLTYKVSGLIGDDKLIKDPTLTTNANENQTGSYTITAANADAGDNYTITCVSGELTIIDQNTEVMTRIEITELTDVPDGLKDTEFDTVDKITEKLISRILATATGYSAENMVHYDVTWQFSLDSGETWIRAMAEHFPTEGITVTFPYPEGTNARDYDFVVSHMFSVNSQRLGITAGDVELPKVEETADGIRVTLNGLSPVTVAAKYHDHTGGTATCTGKAICTVCGTAYGELDATNHAGGTEIKNAKDATCGTEGYTGDTHCTGCGELVTKGTTIQATGEHTYGEWKVVKEATKTAKGEKQRTCSICGHVDSEEIPMLSDIPATGDDSNIMLWGGTMVISLAALVVLLVESKKRRTAK